MVCVADDRVIGIACDVARASKTAAHLGGDVVLVRQLGEGALRIDGDANDVLTRRHARDVEPLRAIRRASCRWQTAERGVLHLTVETVAVHIAPAGRNALVAAVKLTQEQRV